MEPHSIYHYWRAMAGMAFGHGGIGPTILELGAMVPLHWVGLEPDPRNFPRLRELIAAYRHLFASTAAYQLAASNVYGVTDLYLSGGETPGCGGRVHTDSSSASVVYLRTNRNSANRPCRRSRRLGPRSRGGRPRQIRAGRSRGRPGFGSRGRYRPHVGGRPGCPAEGAGRSQEHPQKDPISIHRVSPRAAVRRRADSARARRNALWMGGDCAVAYRFAAAEHYVLGDTFIVNRDGGSCDVSESRRRAQGQVSLWFGSLGPRAPPRNE
jgi:hypothetical protein